MADWISQLDKWLPHWFENTQLQWMQWIYALWQLVRENPLTLLVLSFLPFYLAQRRNQKTVVVVGASKDYHISIEETFDYFRRHPENNLQIVGKGPVGESDVWLAVEYGGYKYWVSRGPVCELAHCLRLYEKNMIFVEKVLPVTGSLAVGRKLSQKEAYEKIFTKRLHCGKGTGYVVPTFIDYIDLNSKIWGVLSTIPILLQARSYNRLSNLLSVVIIILDFNRVWLYKVYDNLFDKFAKFVKLRVFKKRTAWYNFFSIFSSRWKFTDDVKKYAYIAQPGDELKIGWYSKLDSFQDIEIAGYDIYDLDPNDQNICMEIVKDRAYCRILQYMDLRVNVILRKPVYIP